MLVLSLHLDNRIKPFFRINLQEIMVSNKKYSDYLQVIELRVRVCLANSLLETPLKTKLLRTSKKTLKVDKQLG